MCYASALERAGAVRRRRGLDVVPGTGSIAAGKVAGHSPLGTSMPATDPVPTGLSDGSPYRVKTLPTIPPYGSLRLLCGPISRRLVPRTATGTWVSWACEGVLLV